MTKEIERLRNERGDDGPDRNRADSLKAEFVKIVRTVLENSGEEAAQLLLSQLKKSIRSVGRKPPYLEQRRD